MKALVIGGAGFIGCHLAARLAKNRYQVIVLDNLSRQGTLLNVRWLRKHRFAEILKGDIRDFKRLRDIFKQKGRFDVILHQAAQATVTKSLLEPRSDFEINALGTLNVLETARLYSKEALLIYASTNKVYGRLLGKTVTERNGAYHFTGDSQGINESQSLDFHSPYGCSKGTGDAYVLDYARNYGLRTIAFRQSCIYGPRQFGTEDQGWITWFAIALILHQTITLYGNGKQVRDVLYINDLTDLYVRAIGTQNQNYGEPYNVGGGPSNITTLLDCLRRLEQITGLKARIRFDQPRLGDQRVYISDIRKVSETFDWKPNTDLDTGLRRVCEWVGTHKDIFRKLVTKKKQRVVTQRTLKAPLLVER